MTKVGSRELKNRLGKYLARVGTGESILVTDRGKPVAKLVPVEDSPPPVSSLDELLKRLEAEGHLRMARRPLRRITPVRAKGKPASRIIIEERE